MVKAIFEHEGNSGTLTVTCHFGQVVAVSCDKNNEEIFRLGGTAINEVAVYEGVIETYNKNIVSFKAFKNSEVTFKGTATLSSEKWDDSDRHCYLTEHYQIDMENKSPAWFASKSPVEDPNRLFINLDVLDGGGNLIKRYRVSPFTGEYKCLTL